MNTEPSGMSSDLTVLTIVISLLVSLLSLLLGAFLIARKLRSPHGPTRPVPPEGDDQDVAEAQQEEQEEKQREKNDFFNKWIVPNLGLLTYFGGAFLVTLIALFEPFWLSASWGMPLGIVLWSGVYLAFGLVIIPQQEAWVIERFGQFQRTANAGLRILCFQGFIDKLNNKVSLQWKSIPLWTDEKGVLNSSAEIDFEGGVSAPVEVEVIYRVISPFAWTYQVSDGRGYIEAVIDAALRPALQALTLEEANKRKGQLGQEVLNGNNAALKKAMDVVGVELHPTNGILVKDIDIPEDIKRLRSLELEGKQNALKATAQAAGYTGAIKAIMTDAKASGHEMSWKEAEALYFQNRSLETIATTGANVTMIGDNILGIAQSILGKKTGGPSSTPAPANPSPQGEGGQSVRRRGNQNR